MAASARIPVSPSAVQPADRHAACTGGARAAGLVCRGRIEDGTGGQVYLDFSTRLAVVEFAKSLLAAAYYEESGMREWDPQDGLPKDRVRLTDDSAKLLLFYGHDSPVPSD